MRRRRRRRRAAERLRLSRRADRARDRAQLDAFVTKTVTPLPRGGQPAGADRRDRRRDAQLDRPREPRPRRFLAETLPRLRGARDAAVGLGRRLRGRRVRRTCALLEERDDRAQPLLPERRRRRPSRRPRSSPPAAPRPAAAVREALAATPGTWPQSRARSRRRAPTGSRWSTRCAGWSSTRDLRPVLGTGVGGLSGPALKPVALAAVYACYRATSLPIVGMGGVRDGPRRARAARRRASAVPSARCSSRTRLAPARIRDELAAELAALGLSAARARRAGSRTKRRCLGRHLDMGSRV